MSNPVAELISRLDLERLEVDLFRGDVEAGENGKRVFGGHVIAQALAAAYHTVEGRACHSLHAYFIRPGDTKIPIVYEVDRARDGGSFTTRRVVAIQHGRQILNLAASFQKDEPGWEFQHDMPDVPGPEGLRSREELRREMIERSERDIGQHFARERAIEIREVDPIDMLNPTPTSDANQLWFRLAERVEAEPWMQHCMMAYASDISLLSSGTRRHGISWLTGDMMGASLDHAMWFHRPTRFDEWHLYSMDSPFTGGARAFNRGAIYTRDGVLVASVAQEGLMRPVDKTRKG